MVTLTHKFNFLETYRKVAVLHAFFPSFILSYWLHHYLYNYFATATVSYIYIIYCILYITATFVIYIYIYKDWFSNAEMKKMKSRSFKY